MSSDPANKPGTTDNKETGMKIPVSPARASTLLANLSHIQSQIASATRKHNVTKPIRLVAVSKLKPASDILALHQPPSDADTSDLDSQPPPPPHLHFGENYVQELTEKARLLPHSIRWHFIGGLQSNKCQGLARDVPNLWAVESVDSIKKANLLNKGRGEAAAAAAAAAAANGNEDGAEKQQRERGQKHEPLRVFVQVNTSGEESKAGVGPRSAALLHLCRHVYSDESCPRLRLQGLMTIGAIARSQATAESEDAENADFVTLRESRDWVVSELGGRGGERLELELSMGMSADFEAAVAQGSDEVRVGSDIFGERPPRQEAKVLETTGEEKK